MSSPLQPKSRSSPSVIQRHPGAGILSFLDFCDQQQVIFHTPLTEAPLTGFPVFPFPPPHLFPIHSQDCCVVGILEYCRRVISWICWNSESSHGQNYTRRRVLQVQGIFSPARAAVSTVSPGNKSSRIGFVRLSLT